MKNPWKDALTKRRMDGLDLTIMVMPGKPEMEVEQEGEDSEMAPDAKPEGEEQDMSMMEDGRMKMSPLRKKVMGK